MENQKTGNTTTAQAKELLTEALLNRNARTRQIQIRKKIQEVF